MSTTSTQLTIRDLEVDVLYQDIKNLHIGVYPPAGRVRVAAPSRLDDDQVRLAVIKRLPWIRKQRAELEAAPRLSERELVAGESHYVWGVRRRLKIVERPGRIHFEIDGDRLVLYTPADVDTESKRAALDRWYRALLRTALSAVIAEWEERLGVSVPRWSIRRMKTKWGSCNRETHHLWFNLELAKKSPRCLEYIVVHEMTHYRERNHGERFARAMDQVMPDWRSRRDELNAAPLADEML
ncbi:M48 family metallopeptidase [Nocardioides sp. WG-D5]